MKTAIAIFKKEMSDILRNRRRLIALLVWNLILFPLVGVLPGFITMNKATTNIVNKVKIPTQGMEYAPELIEYIETNSYLMIVPADNVVERVRSKKSPAGLIIPSDYAENIEKGFSARIKLVVDKTKSTNFEFERLKDLLNKHNQIILNHRLRERGLSEEMFSPLAIEEMNTATTVETTGAQLGFLVPGFIIAFSMLNGMFVSINIIAGEKDRQTLEPMLFTPISRSGLVLGKLATVLANMFFSALVFVSGLIMIMVFFIGGALFSMRNLDISISDIPTAFETDSPGFPPLSSAEAIFPDAPAVLILIASILPIILLGTSIQIVISSLARSSDEAAGYSLPLSAISLTPLLAGFFLDDFFPSLWHYAIPIFGTVLSMRDLLGNHIYLDSLTVVFISSLMYAGLAIAASVWTFNHEGVVFRA